MKRSEFSEIVSAVSREQMDAMRETIRKSEDKAEGFANAIAEMPAVSARITADILVRSGLLQLEDD